jgi:hypothetical protein
MADTAVEAPPKEALPIEDKVGEAEAAEESKTEDNSTQIATTEENTENAPEAKPEARQNKRRDDRNGKSRQSKSKYGNKFDPTSKEESSDPVEIRKQVKLQLCSGTIHLTCARSNFTFLIAISHKTNSYSRKLEGMKTMLLKLKLFTVSNVCVASSHFRQ